jgi:radical SAM protein with 4Fe4S-binding SPASM domain
VSVAIAAPPLPREIQVEVTGACNLACAMCLVRYRPKLGRREGAMCLHTFQGIVDELPELEKITLQGLGEPLLAPDLFAMIEYASARGIRMGFNTNATLLTKARGERLIRAGLHWLHVSLDGATAETYESIRDGSDFARVARNVQAFTAAMRRLGAARPRVSLVFVAMRRNLDELPDVVRLADEWGVGRLYVQNLSHAFDDTDPFGDYADIRRFTEREALWADAGPRMRAVFDLAREEADRRGVDLRLPRLEEPERAPRPPGTPGCHWPSESAYVTHEGRVQPCCMVMGADRAFLGDTREEPFGDIWKGSAYTSFRAALETDDPPDVCRGCSLYRGVF